MRKPDAVPGLRNQQTLRECVSTTLGDYLREVDDGLVSDLYAMVLNEVEGPLLEVVMQKARSNQSVAARMLGLNRGTLRKKLRQHELL